MSVVINTNYSATVAANNLAASNNALQKSLNRLSSGSKIVSPSDDAGGLAVAMKLGAIAKRQGAVANNIGNAISFLQTQDGALKVAAKVLDRMGELRTLYTDATKNTSDQANYDTEFIALSNQLKSIVSEKFNGISLFGTNTLSVGVTDDLNTTSAVTVGARDLSNTTATVGIGSLAAGGVSMTSVSSITTVTNALEVIAGMRASNGAEQSRLMFAQDLLVVNKANMEQATSRIMDVDVAEESTQLARWNILVQSGTAMLSQANQTPQAALKLLG